MEDKMPVRFISRISKIDDKRLGFYVPKHVTEFYCLKPGDYKGGISVAHGEVISCPIRLFKTRRTLEGILPPKIGTKGTIVEVWIYRDTWKTIPNKAV